jgi:nucleoside-diphosphate-sugar epimerase
LLTGATGALGSMLLQRLCHQGYDVICLVRAQDHSEARARIRSLVGEYHERVRVVRGDVTKPRCGISDADREVLLGRVRRVLHCAASINFQNKHEAELTNVAGTLHVLELTDSLDASHILHISTAYVIGDAAYLGEGDLSLGQRWNNSYEESKFIGEKMVHAWALKRKECRFTIFRPSILIGCEDGTTSTFDGYYRYFEPIHRVAQSLRARRDKPLPIDVLIADNGFVRVPLALLVADKCINYVPIDWVADMIVAAVETPGHNETYHLVHNDSVRLRDALSWSLNHLRVGGVKVCNTQEEKDEAVKAQTPLVRRLQRQIDIVHDAYIPYSTRDPQFQMEGARRNLGKKFRFPPIIDRKYLERTLSSAQERNWGATK